MGAMSGTAGMSVTLFLGVWSLMMAAMMLPSAAPAVRVYLRTLPARRMVPVGGFVSGYVLAWAATGPVAVVLASAAGRLSSRPTIAHGVAVGAFAACGLYQLTPVKRRCLARCRPPFGQVLRAAGAEDRWRHLRAGASHGGTCVGCCWALMALLLAFGVMNLVAMLGLAVVVLLEKVWRHGAAVAWVVGAAALAVAVAVVFVPELAPALTMKEM
jgi:predicted metal-binding membrane protein